MFRFKIVAGVVMLIGALLTWATPLVPIRIEVPLTVLVATIAFFVPFVAIIALKIQENRTNLIERVMTGILIDEWDEHREEQKAFVSIIRDETPVNREYIPKEMRATVLVRDGYTCVWCGGKGSQDKDENGETWQVDHIVPCTRGGKTVPSNLATTCRRCNNSKLNKTPIEYVRYLQRVYRLPI